MLMIVDIVKTNIDTFIASTVNNNRLHLLMSYNDETVSFSNQI